VALSGIDAHDAGAASAAVTAVQQIGGSIGSAVFTVLYTTAVAASLAGGDVTPVAQLEALVDGYQAAFFWAAVGVFVAAPVAFFMVRPRPEDLLGTEAAVHLG
jgi:hypothetical protein